jgi:large subunit ribosomal protein L4
VFPPQPRNYEYSIPRKVERGALKAALTSKLRDNAVIVVDELKASEKKTKATAELLKRLGATRSTLVVDVQLDDNFNYSARNIAGVKLVASGRLTARDVMNTTRIIATRAAIERLQEVLG